jgi:hypothetical protein
VRNALPEQSSRFEEWPERDATHVKCQVVQRYSSRSDESAPPRLCVVTAQFAVQGPSVFVSPLLRLGINFSASTSARSAAGVALLGILSLAKKYGAAALEDACAAALEIGVPEYRFVRRCLERRPQLTLRQVDPLIRALTEYRDFINLKTKEQTE